MGRSCLRYLEIFTLNEQQVDNVWLLILYCKKRKKRCKKSFQFQSVIFQLPHNNKRGSVREYQQ